MNHCAVELVFHALNEALRQGDYQQALDCCQAIMPLDAGSELNLLHKQLMNLIKDQNINKSIRYFVDNYKHILPPREEIFCPEILIPCYNQGRFLRDALASVPEGIPVTLINDASTDDTADYIERLQTEYHFKLLTNEVNLNQAGSNNRAVSESPNNLFIVLNADDALVNYAVPTILDTFTRYTAVRMVGGDCYPFMEACQLETNRQLPQRLAYSPEPQVYLPSDARQFQHPNDINMTMSSCSFLRSAWEAVQGFWDFEHRVCSFDDRDFQMRVCALFPVVVLKEPLAFYRINSSMGRGRCL